MSTYDEVVDISAKSVIEINITDKKRKKPKDIEEYKKWLETQYGIGYLERIEKYYQKTVIDIEKNFRESDFWVLLEKNLREYNADYLMRSGYKLLIMDNYLPSLEIKPFTSVLGKTFRRNVIDNQNWPDPPKNGWINDKNLFSQINDILRTRLIVKYLDGIDFMIEKTRELSKQCELHYLHPRKEARDEGYYAVHQYIEIEIEIPKIDYDTQKTKLHVEIQITTQLQETIIKMLHKYYEEKRTKKTKNDDAWKWNYKDKEFTLNYLGHILHYIEGMIMEIRDKQERDNQERDEKI